MGIDSPGFFQNPGAIETINAYLRSSGLHEFAEMFSGIIGNPVVIVDNSYKVLAHSQAGGLDDDSWRESIENGYYSDDIIKEIISKYRSDDIGKRNNTPFYRFFDRSKYKRIVSRLVNGEEIIGSIAALCVNDTGIRIEGLIPLASDLAAKFVAHGREDFRLNSNYSYEAVLLDLLLGNVKNELEMRNRIIATKLEKASCFQLLTIPLMAHNIIAARNIKDNCERLLPYCWAIYHDSHIHILRISQGFIVRNGLVDEKIQELAGRYSSQVSMGEPFSDLFRLPEHYKRNLMTLKISRMLNDRSALLRYESYRFLDMALKSVGCDIDGLDSCASEKILRIREYDRQHGSDYFRTLHAFLMSGRSHSATAAKLFTHRNTVFYRMTKLKERFGICLEDMDEYFQTLYSCILMDCKDR
ncbi:MAG: helix-turn-helix domain-containing protein, partial [Clostridiales Family XIII bacterium]|nr:helix-turn-helix domain-containing protein [Clostridiales Family XIII bacterium]